MVRPFRKIQTTDADLNRLQDHIKETFDSFVRHALLGGQLVQAVPLTTGTNTIGHGLGRRYVTWALFRPQAALTLYEAASPDPTKFLVVVASAPATVDLLIA